MLTIQNHAQRPHLATIIAGEPILMSGVVPATAVILPLAATLAIVLDKHNFE